MVKVVFNALPPARVDTPSAPLSILTSFLRHHDIPAEIIYWNLLFEGVLPDPSGNTDATHLGLLPYIYIIAGQYEDAIAGAKANAYMKSQRPLDDILNNSSDYLAGCEELISGITARELLRYSRGDRLLFGISCKYEQWIPGIVLSAYIKQSFPDSRIVLGGLRDRARAEAVLQASGHFDFAIWGEGEYPLLELCRALDAPSPDIFRIPRLVIRQGTSVKASSVETCSFFDMSSRIFPNYDDYFTCLKAIGRAGDPVILPVESTRGCTWNACKFCVYSDGYRNRKKDPEALKEEIIYLRERYQTPYFAFMDNDIVANDVKRLDAILDDLILVRQDTDLEFIAEVIHKDLAEPIIEKFSRAGFGRVHFGYESLSERLLGKMRKRTNFSDNILFVKLARRFGIQLPSANIICGTIGEEDLDILECIDNLHFLRFYYDRNLFLHNIIPLRLAGNTDFHAMLTREELLRFDQNEVFRLLPEALRKRFDPFSLFDFSAPGNSLWELFSRINDFYYDHSYSCSLGREGERVIYTESFDSEIVVRLEIGLLGCHILKETHSRIREADDLIRSCTDLHAGIDEPYVFAVLDFLKQRHLVYFDEAYRSIISVIDADPEFR